MRMIKKLWDRYRLLGFDERALQKCRKKIDIDNLATVRQVSVLLVIIIGILTAFYMLFDNVLIRNAVCLVSFIFVAAIYGVSTKLLRDEEKITSANVNLILNLLSAICFVVATYLGTFAAGDEMAVPSVWMFFFVMLIFNRYPLENLIVLLAAGVVFIICSYITKRPYIFRYDVMHALTSIVAAAFVAWSKSRMKVENILSLMRLQSANLEIMGTVEEQEKEAALLRHQANRDELTGMFKKKVFEEKVKEVLNRSSVQDIHAMAFIDVDNFKQVNDLLGHLYGDKLLKEIGGMIEEKSGETAVKGRFGGDEFVVFYPDCKERAQLEARITEIIHAGKKICKSDGKECKVSLSIGLALYPDGGKTYGQLFEQADKALYRAKAKGKDQYCI